MALDVCPGFSWDRVNFLPSSWYTAVFQIRYENNVDYTLIFLMLLNGACPKSRTYHDFTLCQWGGIQKAGRAPGQDNWPNWPKRCSIPQNAQYIKRRSYLEGHWVLLGDGLGIGQRVMNDYIVHHCFLNFNSIFFFFFVIYLSIAIVIIIVFYFISSIRLLLSQPCGFTFSWFFWSHCGGEWGVSEQLCGT